MMVSKFVFYQVSKFFSNLSSKLLSFSSNLDRDGHDDHGVHRDGFHGGHHGVFHDDHRGGYHDGHGVCHDDHRDEILDGVPRDGRHGRHVLHCDGVKNCHSLLASVT